MIVFSNGTPRMLDAILDAAGLRPYFEGYVSVDDVQQFKPSPKTYRRAAERLGRPIGEVRLISSNPFDDIGAEAAGMRATWVDRSGGAVRHAAPTTADDRAVADRVSGQSAEVRRSLTSQRGGQARARRRRQVSGCRCGLRQSPCPPIVRRVGLASSRAPPEQAGRNVRSCRAARPMRIWEMAYPARAYRGRLAGSCTDNWTEHHMTDRLERLTATQVREAGLTDWRQILGRIKARFAS